MSRHGHNKVTKNREAWKVKESVTRPESNPLERVDLNPHAFSRLVEQKGVAVKVYRTSYCPRVKSVDAAEHEIDCPLCNGSGFIDLEPICTKAFIQSQDLEKMHHVEGLVDGNHVAVTFPIGVELQYFTLIQLEDFTEIFIQRVMRKPDSDIDVLKYKACRVNFVIDYDGVRYYQDMDFAIDLNGNVKWLSGYRTRTLTFSAVPDAGSWTLSYGDEEVGVYPAGTAAATIQTDLRALTGFTALTVTGSETLGFTVAFIDTDIALETLATTDTLTIDSNPITITITSGQVGSRRPVDTKPYSIHFEAAVQYRCVRAMHVNRFSQYKTDGSVEHLKFPEQWLVAKEFLVRRKDVNGNDMQQGPYDVHEIVEED